MSTNIKNTLLEARKAYRFLYEYQKRILDLVSYIGSKYGFKYEGGYSKFSHSAPKDGKGYLDNWAWDWLNLYFYEFNFEKRVESSITTYFSIFILNDTGFFISRDNGKEPNKLNIDSFHSVEQSESKLIFVVGKNIWSGWGYDWDSPEFISEPFGQKKEGDNALMLFKHYPLEKFENEENALDCIEDFEQYCLSNNVNLNIKRNPFK